MSELLVAALQQDQQEKASYCRFRLSKMQLVIRINQEILGSLNTIPPRSQEASPQDLVWGSDIGCNLSWKNLGKPLYDGWGSSLVVMALHNIAVDLVRSE